MINHNCLTFRFGKASVYDNWEFEQKGKDLQVQVKGSLISNDSPPLLNAALNGVGIIYHIEEIIEKELKAGKLEVVLDSFSCKGDGFYLYFPKASQVMPKLRAFIDHIKHNSIQP